jgi:hypothetical protein
VNECLSAVLLTLVDKREEFHLACWLKIDLLVNFFNYFIFVLLINLHHTVEYAQLQIFTNNCFCMNFLKNFFQRIWNQHQILCSFIHISKCCEKNICGVILALLPTLNPNTHKMANFFIFFLKWIRIYFPILISNQQVLKSSLHKFGMQNLWIYYSKA